MKETCNANLFPDTSGVYIIQNVDDANQQYVGSATDFSTRMGNHYSSVRNALSESGGSKLHVFINQSGITNFQWHMVKEVPNYFMDFIKLHPESTDNKTVFHILQAFTQYEARSIEQAVISAIEPQLNTNFDVTFLGKWNSLQEYTDSLGSKSIQVITKGGDTFNFSSIRSASKFLDVPKRNIQTYLNYNYYFTSKPLDQMVKFVDSSMPLRAGHPSSTDHLPLFPGIDFDSIPEKTVHVYNTDLKLLDTYSSATSAAKDFGVNKRSVLLNINKKFVKGIIAGATTFLLFCRKPGVDLANNIATIVTDIKSGISYSYPSIGQAKMAIGAPVSINARNNAS